MEILTDKFHTRQAEYEIEHEGKFYYILFAFELFESYSDCFNPGSYYGHYEKFSGYSPEDVIVEQICEKISGEYVQINQPENFEEVIEELEQHLLKYYDCN